jgi:uncharacterized membrane protein
MDSKSFERTIWTIVILFSVIILITVILFILALYFPSIFHIPSQLIEQVGILSSMFMVIATLLLVGATAQMVRENSNLRKQNQESENRDRNERFLDRVENWLVSLVNLNIQTDHWIQSRTGPYPLQEDVTGEIRSLHMQYQLITEEGNFIVKVVEGSIDLTPILVPPAS